MFTLLDRVDIAAAFISKRVLACALEYLIWIVETEPASELSQRERKDSRRYFDVGHILVIHTVFRQFKAKALS